MALNYPLVPSQALTDALEPVIGRVNPTEGRDRPRGDAYNDFVTLHELHAMSAIKTDPCRGTGVFWDLDLQRDIIREKNWSKREGMWTDWSKENGRYAGMYHTTTRRERISGRPSWRCDDDPVSLDSCNWTVVTKDLQIAEKGSRSSVDHKFVEHVIFLCYGAFEGLVVEGVVLEVVNTRRAGVVRPDGLAHNNALESHAHGDRVVIAVEYISHVILVVREVEGCEKAHTTKVERHDRGHSVGEQISDDMQDEPVAAQTHDEVDIFRIINYPPSIARTSRHAVPTKLGAIRESEVIHVLRKRHLLLRQAIRSNQVAFSRHNDRRGQSATVANALLDSDEDAFHRLKKRDKYGKCIERAGVVRVCSDEDESWSGIPSNGDASGAWLAVDLGKSVAIDTGLLPLAVVKVRGDTNTSARGGGAM